MTKKLFDGFERFDGYPVEHYAAKLSGSFDDDEMQLEDISFDDSVCLLVIARAGEVKIKENKDGELVRENTFNPKRVVQISPEWADEILEAWSQGTEKPQLPFHANPSTGEIPEGESSDLNDELTNVDEELDDAVRRAQTDLVPTRVGTHHDPILNRFLESDDE